MEHLRCNAQLIPVLTNLSIQESAARFVTRRTIHDPMDQDVRIQAENHDDSNISSRISDRVQSFNGLPL